MTELLQESEIDIGNINIIRRLISHIESTIGKIPEIKRLYDHFQTIFSILSLLNNKLGRKIYHTHLQTEVLQLQSVFNYDPSKLISLICLKDYKQFKHFSLDIHKKKVCVDSVETHLNTILGILKGNYIKLVEKLLPKKMITTMNKFYIKHFRDINEDINRLRSFKHDINFIIKPNESCKFVSHKDYLCAAEPVFGLSQDEYRDLIIDDKIIVIHSSRKYNCSVSQNSFELFINECMTNAYPKITGIDIELYVECPCKKINGIPCTKKISIDDLLIKYKKFDDYKLQLIEKKKSLMKDIYGVDIFIRCPKPDCPNGDGFTLEYTIRSIIDGTNSSEVSPIHKCTLCNTIWCSKCDKSHPGRICPEPEDEALDPNIKRCPKCKILTTRDGGCFHMNCSKCNVHWCWECNHFTPQSDAYSHNCMSGTWLN